MQGRPRPLTTRWDGARQGAGGRINDQDGAGRIANGATALGSAAVEIHEPSRVTLMRSPQTIRPQRETACPIVGDRASHRPTGGLTS